MIIRSTTIYKWCGDPTCVMLTGIFTKQCALRYASNLFERFPSLKTLYFHRYVDGESLDGIIGSPVSFN